jgi:hypothetical protein
MIDPVATFHTKYDAIFRAVEQEFAAIRRPIAPPVIVLRTIASHLLVFIADQTGKSLDDVQTMNTTEVIQAAKPLLDRLMTHIF